jgi:hypothetical protein
MSKTLVQKMAVIADYNNIDPRSSSLSHDFAESSSVDSNGFDQGWDPNQMSAFPNPQPMSWRHSDSEGYIPGLPDGLFSNQKYQFGQLLAGLRMEKADILYGHLEYRTQVEIFYDHLVHFVFIWYSFPGFGIMYE